MLPSDYLCGNRAPQSRGESDRLTNGLTDMRTLRDGKTHRRTENYLKETLTKSQT